MPCSPSLDCQREGQSMTGALRQRRSMSSDSVAVAIATAPPKLEPKRAIF